MHGHTITEEEQYLPREGWYVVGAHTLNRDYLNSYNRPVAYDWLERYEPVRVFGKSSFLFRFWIESPGHPVPEGFQGTVLTEKQWYDDALERLARARRIRPDSAGGAQAGGRAARARTGRIDDALARFRECGRVADEASRNALKDIRDTIDAWTLSRLSPEDQMSYMQFRQFRLDRFLELHQELIQAVIFAERFKKPDIGIALLTSALAGGGPVSRDPRGAASPGACGPAAGSTIATRRSWPSPWSMPSGMCYRENGQDLTTVRRLSREADQMMQQAGRRVRHDPDQAIQEARRALAEPSPGPAQAPPPEQKITRRTVTGRNAKGRDIMEPDSIHLILGTAGHIDHGKTSLVRALTGIDTDWLPEEESPGHDHRHRHCRSGAGWSHRGAWWTFRATNASCAPWWPALRALTWCCWWWLRTTGSCRRPWSTWTS